MGRHEFTPTDAKQAMGLLSDAFRLFPTPGIEPPQPAEWGQFLMDNPQYLRDGAYDSIARLMAADRDSFSLLSRDQQRLGSSLICSVLDEGQLLELAENRDALHG